jgi:hypothetical protein
MVPAFTNQLPGASNDRPDRNLSLDRSALRQLKRLSHEPLIFK